MEETLLKALVWTNYKLFVVLCLIVPLILSIWSLMAKIQSIQRLLLIFWRVASLMAMGIYLLIPVWQIGYLAWFLGHIFVVISLWFWVDINDEIRDLPKSPLRLTLRSWRWAMTFYCTISSIVFIPVLRCTFSPSAKVETFCRVWLEAPWQYKSIFHANSSPGFLGFLGITGLVIYFVYLFYFLTFRLIKQGRIGLEQ